MGIIERNASIGVLATALIIQVLGASTPASAAPLPPESYRNVADFTYMWWQGGLRANPKVFNISTSRYAFSFDYTNCALKTLAIRKTPLGEDDAQLETNQASLDQGHPVGFSAAIVQNGARFALQGFNNATGYENSKLVESGKFFQRRFMTFPRFAPGAPALNSTQTGLEVAAWPDRFSLILRVAPNGGLSNTGVELAIDLPDNLAVTFPSRSNVVGLQAPDGSGYVVCGGAMTGSLNVDAAGGRVAVLTSTSPWSGGSERAAALIVYPVASKVAEAAQQIARSREAPLVITAVQTLPTRNALTVQSMEDEGWQQINIRNDNGNMDRTTLTIQNPNDFPIPARFNFAKGNPKGVVGLSAILRDAEGNPTGIPIQLSKDWHTSGTRVRYDGYWFRGFTMLTVPANQTLTFEYTMVGRYWGKVLAASHAQLSLVGYAGNQLWEEAAVGSQGENICYDPEQHLANAAVTDVRGLLLSTTGGTRWSWTGNVGGADFFRYFRANRNRGYNTRIRTKFKSHGPNLTQVTNAGLSDDGKIDFSYTSQLTRTDDIVRIFYRFRMKVNSPAPIEDYIFYQVGGEGYHYGHNAKFAVGSEAGLVREWNATYGTNRYIGGKQELTGAIPWVSLHDIAQEGDTRMANRGFIIRSWQARLGGKDNARPHYAEWSVSTGHGGRGSIINIVPPPDVAQFEPGDSLDAVVEYCVVPKQADHYYGTNRNLINALQANPNSWNIIHREAVKNNLPVTVTSGRLISRHPIRILTDGVGAAFSVEGGLGYIPVTFTGLKDYRDPKLFVKNSPDGAKTLIDQATEGRDFWQADFVPESGTWDITFNVDLDSPGDAPVRRYFELNGGGSGLLGTDIKGGPEKAGPFSMTQSAGKVLFSFPRGIGTLLSLDILGLDGRVVKSIPVNARPGLSPVIWNWKDDKDARIGKGFYFVRARTTRGGLIMKSLAIRD